MTIRVESGAKCFQSNINDNLREKKKTNVHSDDKRKVRNINIMIEIDERKKYKFYVGKAQQKTKKTCI